MRRRASRYDDVDLNAIFCARARPFIYAPAAHGEPTGMTKGAKVRGSVAEYFPPTVPLLPSHVSLQAPSSLFLPCLSSLRQSCRCPSHSGNVSTKRQPSLKTNLVPGAGHGSQVLPLSAFPDSVPGCPLASRAQTLPIDRSPPSPPSPPRFPRTAYAIGTHFLLLLRKNCCSERGGQRRTSRESAKPDGRRKQF